jgi:hypothetical protein
MTTVDKNFADELVKLNGQYVTDPQIMRIVEYDNAWGGVGYGLEYKSNFGKYIESEYIQNPRIYWEKKQ